MVQSSELLAGCVVALVVFAFCCGTALGSSFRTIVEDALMVLLTEGAMNVAFRSPLDWAHLHGSPLINWALLAGTGLALIGVFLNHLAGRSGHNRNRRRTG